MSESPSPAMPPERTAKRRSDRPRPHGRGDPALAEAILDSVVEAIFVFDADSHTISTVNRGACDLFRRTRADLVGHRIDEFLGPADVTRLTRLFRPRAMGEREVATVMAEYKVADGRPISVEFVLQPVVLPGKARAIVAIARDIGNRIEVQVRLQRLAQAEHARAAELNAVIRAMGEAVVVCQADGSISLANPAAERLFPDVVAHSYADLLAQLHDPSEIAPGLGQNGGPVALATEADRERWLEIATYPVHDDVGLPSGADETIVVMRDVTEARRRDAVRETFIGILSHELRTPLTTIFGGAKLLARETSSLDEDTRRSVFRDIHDEAERLQRLVEDVVALNRFGEGPGEIGWEPVLLQRVVPRVLQSEEGRWPGVTFTLAITPGLPTVSADATYVEQVIRNLISNAAKYGGTGASVTITVEASDQEVLTRVRDDGPGFPAEETGRLFELFYRSPGTASAASGAGIGLFVCARLIAAMGGRIWASSSAEGGGEFGFALNVLDE